MVEENVNQNSINNNSDDKIEHDKVKLNKSDSSIYRKITLTDHQIEAMTEFQEYFWNVVMWGHLKSLKRKSTEKNIPNTKSNKEAGENNEEEENNNEIKIPISPDSECRMYMILPVKGFPLFNNYNSKEDVSDMDSEKDLSFLVKDYELLKNWQRNYSKRWPKLPEIPDPVLCKWEIDWPLVERVVQGPKISLYTWIRVIGDYIFLREKEHKDGQNQIPVEVKKADIIGQVAKETESHPEKLNLSSLEQNKSKLHHKNVVYYKMRNSFDVLYDVALEMENKNVYQNVKGQADPSVAYSPEVMEKLDKIMNQTYILTEHNNNRYILKRIRQDITPKTNFYSSRYKINLSYLDYATITNKATVIEHPDSVMIEASHIKITTNMLKPSSQWNVIFSKSKSAASAESQGQVETNATTVQPQSNKSKTILGNPFSTVNSSSSLFLIPDICKILPIPMELYRLAYVIPSLLHRIDRYMIVSQFKNKLNLPISHNQTLFSAFCSCSAHEGSNYERLENLGDSFIKFSVSIDIFKKYPNLDEGGMTFHRGKIICNKNLYEIALRKNFDALMFVNAFNPKGWQPPKVQTPYATVPMEISNFTNNNTITSIDTINSSKNIESTTNTIDNNKVTVASSATTSTSNNNSNTDANTENKVISSVMMAEPTSYVDSPKTSVDSFKEENKKNDGSRSNSVNYDSNSTDPSNTKTKLSKRKSKKMDNTVSLYQSTKGPLWRVISKKTLADFVESLTAAYYIESGFNTAIRFCQIIGLISENINQCFKNTTHTKQDLNDESRDKLKLAQSVINSDVNRFIIIYKHLYQAKFNDLKKINYGFINNNIFYQSILNSNGQNKDNLNFNSNNYSSSSVMNPMYSMKYPNTYPSNSENFYNSPYYPKRKFYDYGSSYSNNPSTKPTEVLEMSINDNLQDTNVNKKKRRKRSRHQKSSIEDIEFNPIPEQNLSIPSPMNDTDIMQSTDASSKEKETATPSFLQINENIVNKLRQFYQTKIKNQNDMSLQYLAKIFPFDAIEEKLHYHFKNRLYLVEAFTHASYTSVITHNYERLEFLGDATLDWILIRFFFLTYPSASAAELSELRQAAVNNESLARLSIGLGYHYYLMHHSITLQNEISMYIDMLEKNKTSSKKGKGQNQNSSTEKTSTKKKGKKNITSSTSANANSDINTFTDVSDQHPLQSTYEGPKVLGDLFEAVIGAVLVDSNYNVATVWRVFRPLLSDFLDKHASPENLNQSTVRGVHEYCQKLGFAVNDLQYR